MSNLQHLEFSLSASFHARQQGQHLSAATRQETCVHNPYSTAWPLSYSLPCRCVSQLRGKGTTAGLRAVFRHGTLCCMSTTTADAQEELLAIYRVSHDVFGKITLRIEYNVSIGEDRQRQATFAPHVLFEFLRVSYLPRNRWVYVKHDLITPMLQAIVSALRFCQTFDAEGFFVLDWILGAPYESAELGIDGELLSFCYMQLMRCMCFFKPCTEAHHTHPTGEKCLTPFVDYSELLKELTDAERLLGRATLWNFFHPTLSQFKRQYVTYTAARKEQKNARNVLLPAPIVVHGEYV